MMETFTDNDWIENFRVSKDTFLYLCMNISYAQLSVWNVMLL